MFPSFSLTKMFLPKIESNHHVHNSKMRWINSLTLLFQPLNPRIIPPISSQSKHRIHIVRSCDGWKLRCDASRRQINTGWKCIICHLSEMCSSVLYFSICHEASLNCAETLVCDRQSIVREKDLISNWFVIEMCHLSWIACNLNQRVKCFQFKDGLSCRSPYRQF